MGNISKSAKPKRDQMLASRGRAIEYSSQGVVITDATQPHNPIIDANPAFEVLTGYSRDEILGKSCSFLQGDDKNQKAINRLRKAITTEKHIRVELRNYRKDGTLFWNELTISPVYDSDGRLINFVGIQQDITDRVLAIEALKEAKVELESLNQALKVQTQNQKTIDERINDLLKQSGFGRDI